MTNPDLLIYEPSEKDRDTISRLYNRLQEMVQMRNKSYSYFNNRSLTSYIDESIKRWNSFIPPRGDLEQDWQARVFNSFTRNVCISLLSRIAMTRPRSRFVATNKDGFQDTLRAHILEKGLEYTYNKENGDWKFFLAALEMVTKGTVVVYEGYKKVKRKVKEIKKFDPVTGAVDYTEKTILDYNDCYQEIVPLEEIYFGNLWINDIQQMPDIIWKRVMMNESFKEDFKKYPNAKYVKPGTFATVVETIPYYKQKEYFQLDRKSVEVVQWYNKWKDELIITANGVLLYDGPIPFHHKSYPFASAIFEPFAVDFIYGRSLPDKVSSDQDVINTLWNMMLDQGYLSIYKPTLTDDPDYIDEYPLQPGRMFPVSDINKYRVLSELTGPDPSHFQMLEMAIKFANDNSGNILGGGMSTPSAKGKMTARQAQILQDQMMQALGLNTRMLENLEIQSKRLRAKNFLQFYTVPEKVEAITGEKDAIKNNFVRVLRIDDTELTDGTHGTAVIKIVDKEKNLPSPEDLDLEEEVAAVQGQNVEVHAITPDYIRNLDFDVQIVGESSYQQSRSLKQALELEFVQVLTSNPAFQPLINAEELLRDLFKVYDKDPDRLMKELTPPPDGQNLPPQLPESGGKQVPPITRQLAGASPAKSLEKVL
jgi:hypothetical protein